MQITTIGLDLAKNVFHMASMLKVGSWFGVNCVVRRCGSSSRGSRPASLEWKLAAQRILGPRTYRDGASGEDHAAVLRESIR
jgi:hypothetical protein